MKIFVQHRNCPSQILFAFDEVANAEVEKIRWAVAYTTQAGCRRLFSRLSTRMGESVWEASKKQFITSLDYGLTEPSALESLANLSGADVHVANASVINNKGFRPAHAYHPKIYLFDQSDVTGYVVGSANLTNSALLANTETVSAGLSNPHNSNWDEIWNELLKNTEPLTPGLLNTYRDRWVRPARRPVDPDIATIPSEIVVSDAPVLAESIADDSVNPLQFQHFWIEAGYISGGSRNQLELPRGANRFFQFSYSSYGDEHVTIGTPTLTLRDQSWEDRPLTWHGNNRMERINLPTRNQGGFDYPNTAILFRRHQDGYELDVQAWDDETALAWRTASDSLNSLFRLGERGSRICGFF